MKIQAATRRSAQLRTRRGVAAVEFALVLPLLLTVLLGVWDFGRLIDAYQAVSNAAREAGRCMSTGSTSTAATTQVVTNYLTQAGIPTTGVTVTTTNMTSSARPDPTTANQLDRFQVVVTVPSNNVRWILLKNLLGTSTLRATCTWSSMNDIPLTVPTTIPIN